MTTNPSHITRFMRSPPDILHRALVYLNLRPGDRFIDIGSGDGLVLKEALKVQPALEKAVGLELRPALVEQSKELLKDYPQAQVLEADFQGSAEAHKIIREANKIYFFLDTGGIENLLPVLSQHATEGSRILSIDFPLDFKALSVPGSDRFSPGLSSMVENMDVYCPLEMFRNPYDTDCITWSPQGRIFQIEYAMEAVKQGTAVVALRGKKHAVLCAFRRRQSELASYQQKVFRVDDHIGVAISGLTADARVICSFMRDECLSHKFTYDTPMSVGRLVSKIGVESQEKTQVASKRPYGVGLLVAGYDETGPHIYETCPSGNIFEYYAMAIGGRSQSARTYLENNYESFDNITDQKELLMHGLKALAKTLQDDATLTTENCSVAIVGEDLPFKELNTDELQSLISNLEQAQPEATEAAPMDTSE